MNGPVTVARRILQFNEELAETTLELPPGFTVINPFTGPQQERVREVTTAFYHKYYDDDKPRRLVLGSSPARRGTAVTGVPFEDAKLLESETGVDVDGYAVSRPSAGFLHDVIRRYGGRDKFYADFVMSFVCPLGLVRTNHKRNEVNCNYYENKKLLELLHSFLVDTLERQLAFGTDTSVCYCIGSGENFKFLSKVNEGQRFFQRIVPLEHPRFITQYNRDREEEFAEKYLSALRGEGD
ncbi:uracil-DNA glycosylase family protein [Streptomyces graminilatus]|uniref:uracil-DNA glycosylase family protein n=1 Tax=Streptomyces graminilatus TaxID=1464070 RepID=UPI0006E12A33|nr:uracil-DNA glycosylase family protein [Streptomyces graminilatus]